MTTPAPTPPTFSQRPWVAAGVALTAAGMVAATPVAAPTLQQVNAQKIQLVAQDLVGDTVSNLTNLVDYFAGQGPAFLSGVGVPFPVLQQLLANQIDNLGAILSNPGDIGTVFESMFNNLQAGITAPFGAFADSLATGGPLSIDVFGTGVTEVPRTALFALAQGLIEPTGLGGLLDFTASPVSGLMLGALGPVLGPMIVLGDGLSAAFDGNPADLLSVPQDMLYAFLNGGQNLSVLPLLDFFGIDNPLEIAPFTMLGIDKAGVELGGILGGPGSLFNALSAVAGLEVAGVDVAGISFEGAGAGPLGSLLSIPNSIAAAIGTGGIDGLQYGLLGTIANSFDLTEVVNGLGDIHSFISDNLLTPVTSFLTDNVIDTLANGLTDLLGADLGIDALASMFLNIPELLLTMLL